MGYAFISYGTEDTQTAEAVRELFYQNGIKTWMAPYNIISGEWAAEIAIAIMKCSCFVLILSNDSQDSVNVRKEISVAAITYQKPIIPMEIETVVLKPSLIYLISNHNIIPVKEIDGNNDVMKRIIKAVKVFTDTDEDDYNIIGVSTDSESVKSKPETIKYEDGSVFFGYTVNGKKNGKGRFIWRDGSAYEGDFLDDKRTGKGRIVWASGSVYEGDFVDGRLTGRGFFLSINGDAYVGEFFEDLRVGKGKYTWADGNIYEGDYIDGKRTGKGRFIWNDGTVYEGDFIDGKMTGQGKLIRADGTVIAGEFVDGKPVK